jgi:hypothetical protein
VAVAVECIETGDEWIRLVGNYTRLSRKSETDAPLVGNSEIRNQKSEGNPKPEIRRKEKRLIPISGFWFRVSDFGFRISFGFLVSDFGLWVLTPSAGSFR